MSYAYVAMAVISALGTAYSANKSADAQQKASDAQSRANADAIAQQKSMQAAQEKYQTDQLKLAEQDTNKLNAKRPNTSSLLSMAQQASKAGPSGTMLSGPQGVDPNSLSLGRSTLLGS